MSSFVNRKMMIFVVAMFGFMWSSSAFALAPCSSITNLAQLMQAGTCYLSTYTNSNGSLGSDNVTISNVVTNIPSSAHSLVGVSIGVSSSFGALAAVVFNTDGLNGNPAYAHSYIALEAQCDGSCQFNDATVRVQGFPGSGSGTINQNSSQIIVPTNMLFADNFSQNVSNVRASADMTQTEIPGKAESLFEFYFNTVPTGASSLPPQCVTPTPGVI